MKVDLELSLIHDGTLWVASNNKMVAKGESLADLDEDIKRALQDCGQFAQGSRVKIFMGFDFDSMPTWLRQYHSHYFNRLVEIDL